MPMTVGVGLTEAFVSVCFSCAEKRRGEERRGAERTVEKRREGADILRLGFLNFDFDLHNI